MKQYDALIIGFGKAGKTLAGTLGDAGWNVAIIEQSAQMYGGTCINIACIPTKSLLHDALDGHVTYSDAIIRKNQVTSTLRAKNFTMLDNRQTVDIYTGQAHFISDHEVQVTAGEEVLDLRGEKIFINTGTEPFLPPIAGLDTSSHVYTSTTLMERTDLPSHLTIIGGGNIGLEFATTYAKFGSRVTILDSESRALVREDEDIAAVVQAELEALGITFIFGAQIDRITDQSEQTTVEYRIGDTTRQVKSDAVLIATGRSPVTKDLQLNVAGVQITDRGYIIVDDRLQTSIPHIWALGDVNGGPQFTYISLDDFRIVKDTLIGEGKRRVSDRTAVPYTLFLSPTLARVGLSEAQARAAGCDVSVATLPVAAIPRSLVGNDTRGVLKAVVDRKTHKILGVALFCTNAQELINLVSLAMSLDQDYTVLRDRTYTHPTMTEAFNDLFGLITL